MAMCIEAEFARPLTRAQKVRVLVAIACLSKSDRVRFAKGDHVLVVTGEALGSAKIVEVLAEEGLVAERISNSLSEDLDRAADDVLNAPAGANERLRPIGR